METTETLEKKIFKKSPTMIDKIVSRFSHFLTFLMAAILFFCFMGESRQTIVLTYLEKFKPEISSQELTSNCILRETPKAIKEFGEGTESQKLVIKEVTDLCGENPYYGTKQID